MSKPDYKTNTRIPPSNTDSERAFLGSILLNPDLVEKAQHIIKPEYFYDTKHKIICYAIFDMFQRRIPIDLVTIKDRILGAKKLDDIGGMSYLTELPGCVPSSSNWKKYAEIVKGKFKARKALEIMESISATIYEDGTLEDNIKNRLDQLELIVDKDFEGTEEQEKLLNEMGEYDGDDKIISMKEIYDSINIDKSESINTGWEKFDSIVNGMRPSHLIVLAGLMKGGKTSFAMSMSTKLQKYNPLWLAIEETIDELMIKFKERGEEAPNGFSPKSLAPVTIKWIDRKIAEGIKKFKTKIVFIDNLSWIRLTSKKGNTNKADIIEETMIELKTLAKKWNVVIVIISHVNGESSSSRVPTFENLKGSTGIGQVGDKTIIVWRECKEKDRGELEFSNNTSVSIQLNRQGGVGTVHMIYENGHFREFDWVAKEEDDSFGAFSGSIKQKSF